MKKAVIVFTDEWLPYSSTVLNLLTCLKENKYETRIVTVRSGYFLNFQRFQNDVESFRIPPLVQLVFGRIRLYRLLKFVAFTLLHGRTIRRADLCLSVDSIGFLVARLLQKNPYYVSLEIERDAWFWCAKSIGIRHMLIQTKERFDFLFRDPKRRPTFSILPNSPIQASFEHHPSEPQHLIYFGLISASHGVESCIEALRCLPDSYRMTLKGPASPAYMTTLELKYREFFESTRLTYEASYLATVEVLPYLSRFAMGFCFYDFNIIARNDFNYVSCPSGKLYSYLAAGIPVIGSDILGLQVVHEKDCGLLLKEPNPEAIAGAVRKIEQDLLAYQKRCRAAATQFDFRDHFSRFYETIPLRERVSVG